MKLTCRQCIEPPTPVGWVLWALPAQLLRVSCMPKQAPPRSLAFRQVAAGLKSPKGQAPLLLLRHL
eukprot:3162168-Amphidinium_carterae.1